MGQFNWFQFESLNQSINHQRKGFQRQVDSSWNTSRYIFHAPDQPLKSLSFDINSPRGPQRPWAVHLHAGQARPLHIPSAPLYSPRPGRFTVQQLCTPNSTSARQIQESEKTPCSRPRFFAQRATGPARPRGGVTWNHERSRQGSLKSTVHLQV